jgi:hypothetical protein
MIPAALFPLLRDYVAVMLAVAVAVVLDAVVQAVVVWEDEC